MSRGQACSEVREWICGGGLTALEKKDGGFRPIAVGECWRRLVGKVLVKEADGEVRRYLEPVQVGVGTRCGTEAVVHVARQWLGRNAQQRQKVLATTDLSNAFNCADRSAFRQAARRVRPSWTAAMVARALSCWGRIIEFSRQGASSKAIL